MRLYSQLPVQKQVYSIKWLLHVVTWQDYVTDFGKMDDEIKDAFFNKASDLMGQPLKKQLEQAITQSHVKTQSWKFKGHGNFHPKEYFEQKYKDKPEELANVFANARTMEHPDSKANLWEDREFSLLEERGEDRTEERQRQIRSTEEKKIKKPKAKGTPTKRKALEGDSPELGPDGQVTEHLATPVKKPLPKAQAKKMAKLTDKGMEVIVELAGLLVEAKSKELSGYVAPLMLKGYEDQKGHLDETLLKSSTMIGEGSDDKEGTKEFIEAFGKEVTDLQAVKEKLSDHLQDVRETMMAASGAGS